MSANESETEEEKESEKESVDTTPSEYLKVELSFAGQVYYGDGSVHHGIEKRMKGTIFDSMLSDPSNFDIEQGQYTQVFIETEDFPDAVVDLFPDIWNFLQNGVWTTEATTLSRRIRWQEAVAYVGIKHPRVPTEGKHLNGILVNNQLLQLPPINVFPGDRTFCSEFEETACIKAEVDCAFDDESVEGAAILRSRLGAVKINPELGSLSLKLPESPEFDVITRHALLKDKLMTALVLRESESDFPLYGDGMLLIVQVDVRSNAEERKQFRERVLPFVEWPAFWFVVCLKRLGVKDGVVVSLEHRLVELHKEVLPGGLRTLTDGSVILVSNPSSLRKALLSMFLAQKGVVQMPALCVNPIAPQGPRKHVHQFKKPSFYFSRFKGFKGEGKGGRRMQHWYEGLRNECYCPFPTVRTLHPQGRAPQSIWIVKRGQQLVLLMHATDGRVALGQIEGPRGSVPSRWPTHESKSGKVARWDVWCRHDHDAPVGAYKRLSLRNSFAVPICHSVLAVVPRQDEILILQKTQRRDKPKFWRASLPIDSSIPPTFHAFGPDDKGFRKGAWMDTNWFGHRAMEFNEFQRLPAVCEIVFGAEEQPDFEFQRWVLADAGAAIRSNQLHQPVIGPGAGFKRTGGKSADPVYRTGKYWTDAPLPPAEGCFVDQWKTTAKIK